MISELLQFTRIILGSTFVLFIPGFAWTFALFKQNEIDAIERIALSFGLSIALVPLVIFYLNYLLHIKITALNSFIVIIALIAIPIGYIYLKNSDEFTEMRRSLISQL